MSEGKTPKTKLRIPGLALNEDDDHDGGSSQSRPPPERDDQRYHVSIKTRLGINPEFLLADDMLEVVEDGDPSAAEAVRAAPDEPEPGAQVSGDIGVVGGETDAVERDPVTTSMRSIQVDGIESTSYDMTTRDTASMEALDADDGDDPVDDLETRPTIARGFRPRPEVVAPTMKVTAWDPLPYEPAPEEVARGLRPTGSRVVVIAATVVSAVLFAVALYAYLS